MTWAFGYFSCFIVGLVAAAVTGLIRDLRAFARHTAAVPHPDLHRTVLGVFARRAAPGLVLFGVVGMALSANRGVGRAAVLAWAGAAGALAALVATLALPPRERASVPGARRATVVKEILPGGYGQVRLEHDGVAVLLAAQSDDRVPIPAGTEVEIVESTRSVITVRLPARA